MFPGETLDYKTKLKYSGRFRGYNANITLGRNLLTLNLSKNWRHVDRDIKMGLIQELILKLFRKKKKIRKIKTTMNIGLYHTFLKKVHLFLPKTKNDPILNESFSRINERYFYGVIERPNLVWGSNSVRKLGSYEYGTDTISMSKMLINHSHLLDYVMYHELLHKKHQFYSKNGRTFHHTREFRRKEKEYEDADQLEKELGRLVSKARPERRKRKGFFGLFRSFM